MNFRIAACAILALSLGQALPAQIVVYSFTGNTIAPTSFDASVTATSFTGSNNPVLSDASPVFSAGSRGFYVRQSNWSGSAPGTNYFEFTLTPDAGFAVNLTSLSFGSRVTSTGPTTYYFRSSADNYATDLTTGSFIRDDTWYSSGNQSITLSFTSSTTFRLYGNGSSNTLGSLRLDDLTLHGSVSAIPEPSTYALCAGIAALGLVVWQRRQKSRAKKQSARLCASDGADRSLASRA